MGFKKRNIRRSGQAFLPRLVNNPDLNQAYKQIHATLRLTDWAAKMKGNNVLQNPIYLEQGVLKMNPLVEKILLEVLKRIITEEMVQSAMLALVKALSELAQKSDNELDDAMVEIIAKALNVPWPKA